jgi:hypothetical protein
MPNPPLDLFEATFRAGNKAFNRGDFAAAFSGLAPECEFYPLAYATERVLVGPEEVCRVFEDAGRSRLTPSQGSQYSAALNASWN